MGWWREEADRGDGEDRGGVADVDPRAHLEKATSVSSLTQANPYNPPYYKRMVRSAAHLNPHTARQAFKRVALRVTIRVTVMITDIPAGISA